MTEILPEVCCERAGEYGLISNSFRKDLVPNSRQQERHACPKNKITRDPQG